MNPNVPSIEQLKDIALPAPVSYAPQTWGWWVLLAVLIVAVLLLSARRYWQWRRDRYRREALVRLAQLHMRSDDLHALRELPELLKRVAISMPVCEPRRRWRSLRSLGGSKTVGGQDQKLPAFASVSRQAAALSKEAWQVFLQQHINEPLPADFSQQLSVLAYAPDAVLRALPPDQRQQLFNTCKTWLERHHVAA